MMSFQTVFDGSRTDMFWERVPDKGDPATENTLSPNLILVPQSTKSHR